MRGKRTWLVLLPPLVFLGFWMAREFTCPVLPPGDGPLQTMNWLERIGGGQVPGRDFPVFHGLGLLWLHAPLYFLCGRGAAGIVAAFHGTSLLLMMGLFALAAGTGGMKGVRRWGVALWLAVCVLSLPWDVARFFLPGHSMIVARTCLGLGAVLAGWRLLAGECRVVWLGGIAGVLSGLAWFASNDQGPGATGGLLVIAVWRCAVATRGLPARRRAVRAAGVAALLVLVALACYSVLLWLATGGHPGSAAHYYFAEIPAYQFWWFGGPPAEFARSPQELLMFRPMWLALAAWAVLLAGVWRSGDKEADGGRQDRRALVVALFCAGLAGCLPMLGMLSAHYAAGLVVGLVVASVVIYGRWLIEWPARWQAGKRRALLAGGVVVAALWIPPGFQWQWDWRVEHEMTTADTPQLAGLAARYPGHPAPVWSVYRGLAEQELGLGRPFRCDYIIHALGDMAEYDRVFAASGVPLVRTIRPDKFAYNQWLWHTRWGFFREMVFRYEPVATGVSYIDWELGAARGQAESRVLAVAPDGNQWRVALPAGERRGTVVEMVVRYSDAGRSASAGPNAELTRVLVRGTRGALDNAVFAIPPPGPDGGAFCWAMVSDGAPEMRVTLETAGPWAPVPVRLDEASARVAGSLDEEKMAALFGACPRDPAP